MVSPSDINPFGKFDIGLGAIGNALILFFIGVVIVGAIGFFIYLWVRKRTYSKVIPLFKSFNGINLQIAEYHAKVVPISKAGDSLWYVREVKKFLAPATLTIKRNVYPHEEREDGEWINFALESVNEHQKNAGVKFIQQDMRTQRVATGDLLENRLIEKGFWEKYKDIIVHLIFYIVTTLMLVVIFWQWSNITESVGGLVDSINSISENLSKLQCVGVKETNIIPALSLLLFWRKK